MFFECPVCKFSALLNSKNFAKKAKACTAWHSSSNTDMVICKCSPDHVEKMPTPFFLNGRSFIRLNHDERFDFEIETLRIKYDKSNAFFYKHDALGAYFEITKLIYDDDKDIYPIRKSQVFRTKIELLLDKDLYSQIEKCKKFINFE